MRRREFMAILGGAAVWPYGVIAQAPTKVYRVGLLSSAAPVTDNSPFGAALIRGLAQHGYVLGGNVVFERRGAEGHMDRLPHLVEELAASKVDVIVTFGYPPTLAAKGRTALPVVAFGTGDPVGSGLVDSLARPGGNITGISDVAAELTPKRMELLKEIAPTPRRVAMLWNSADPGMTLRYQASAAGAKALGIDVQPLGVRELADFDRAFAAMSREMPDAIFLVADPLTTGNRKRVFNFAAEHRLPATYEFDFFVRDGGLMSYAADPDEIFSRVVALIHRILRGSKPAALPFEQPTRFRLVVNLKTAKTLGITIPQSILLRADEVIE